MLCILQDTCRNSIISGDNGHDRPGDQFRQGCDVRESWELLESISRKGKMAGAVQRLGMFELIEVKSCVHAALLQKRASLPSISPGLERSADCSRFGPQADEAAQPMLRSYLESYYWS